MAATHRDVAYFCPECGSASIEYSELVGSLATCKVCDWTGPQEKLVAYQFHHDFADGTEALRCMMNEMRHIYAAASKMFGEFLLKWGFLDYKQTNKGLEINTKQLARFMAAAAQSTLKAIVAERQKIEKERVDAS